MPDYLKVVYNEIDRPYTAYPGQLAKYLFDRFQMKQNMKFLEIGCGRGDFLKAFKQLGLHAQGLDISKEAIAFNPDINIQIADIEKEKTLYPDNYFDIVYSKSLIEHLISPDKYMNEAYRILKPGGLLLTLVPDWEANYKTYFDDYTHHTPFTKVSLRDIYKMHNFYNVEAVKFRQLPVVWKYPFLNYIADMIAPFIPVRTKNKTLFWMREIMLIGCGYK